jgi:uncharacterized protein YbjT (DUF2867 family)
MRVLVFGATGSAGGSALKAALAAPDVKEVVAVVRRSLPHKDPKLRVIVHENFLDFTSLANEFTGFDACLWALGVSSAQVSKEDDYRRITRDYAVAAAKVLKERSPKIAFQFVSGMSTNINGRLMWARVKGEAERDLTDMLGAVCFRPGAIDGERSASASAAWYAPLLPLFKVFAPFRSMYVTGEDLGRAMLQSTREGLRSTILENRDIRDMADRSRQSGGKT